MGKIEERKGIKAKLISCKTRHKISQLEKDYKENDKEIKRNVRSDKRKWINDMAAQPEKAAQEGNLKEM
jgi:hypothetical protein